LCQQHYQRRYQHQRRRTPYVPPAPPPLPKSSKAERVAIYEEALREILLGATMRTGKLKQLPETVAALRQVARDALERGRGDA
jgi:hypothetical protein